jgi:uncharacterized membrane protein
MAYTVELPPPDPGFGLSLLEPNHPSAINSAGEIVGWFETPTYIRAFIQRAQGAMLNVGTFGGVISRAFDINDKSWVVGSADVAAGWPPKRAFLQDGHALIDLNTRLLDAPGWLLIEAHSINESGQIAAVGFYREKLHAALLTPAAPTNRYAPDPCLVEPVFQAR